MCGILIRLSSDGDEGREFGETFLPVKTSQYIMTGEDGISFSDSSSLYDCSKFHPCRMLLLSPEFGGR